MMWVARNGMRCRGVLVWRLQVGELDLMVQKRDVVGPLGERSIYFLDSL